jgi:hypothetical protein
VPDIKDLVEAAVYDGFTMICRGIAALLIIARPIVFLFIKNNNKTGKKPIP